MSYTSSAATKTSANFQKYTHKTVRGVAFTIFCDGLSDRQTDARGKAICLPTLTGGEIMRRNERKLSHAYIIGDDSVGCFLFYYQAIGRTAKTPLNFEFNAFP